MRIISGYLKGRKLACVKGGKIRPTSDKVREAIFNILSFSVKDAFVLDLFAGTGAFGIEAVSRGAQKVFFLDREKDIVFDPRFVVECKYERPFAATLRYKKSFPGASTWPTPSPSASLLSQTFSHGYETVFLLAAAERILFLCC